MMRRIASHVVYKWLYPCLHARGFTHRSAAGALLLAVLFTAQLAVAATSTWVGNTSANWADSNWTGDNPPLAGDSLVFALAGSSGTTLNNNLVTDNSIAGITFNSGASAFTFNGNEITLNGGITNSGTSAQIINLPMVVTAAQTVTMTGGGGNVTLGGAISGAGGLTTAGIGMLKLNAANTYSGTTTLANVATATPTVLVLGNANALQNSTLAIAGTNPALSTVLFAPGIGTFNIGGLSGGGSTTSEFPLMDTNNQPITLSVGANNANTSHNGGFFGSGTLVKVGTGTLVLNGDSANTGTINGVTGWTGNLVINGGTIQVTSNSTNYRIGQLLPTRTLTINNGGTLLFSVNNVFNNGQNNQEPGIVVNSGGTMNATRYNVVGNITLNGGVNGPATLTQSATDGGNYHGYQFLGNITVAGTAPSVISSGNANGNHLGTNTTFNVADVTGSSAADLTISTALLNQSGDFGNNPGSLTKTGPGTMLLNATANNTYAGTTTISAGSLALSTTGTNNIPSTSAINVAAGAALDVTGVTGAGGFALSGTQTLTNFGTVAGGVTAAAGQTLLGTGNFSGAVTLAGGTVLPGTKTVNSIGTMSMGSLTASSGILQLEIGGATNDLVAVSGAANFSGTTITPVLLSPATLSHYDVLTSGALSGTPTITPGFANFGRVTFSIDPSPPANTVRIDVVGAPANLVWNSVGGSPADGTTWDAQTIPATPGTNQNWHNSGSGNAPDFFFQGDIVTFNDSNGGAASYNVNLVAAVQPTSVTVNNSSGDYVISGSGGIGGFGTLTKSGTRALTLATANTYPGGTTFNAGTLNINNSSAVGTGNLTINGGTLDNTSGAAVTLSTNNTQTWNADFTFTGSNSLNLGTGAVAQGNLANGANRTITVNATTVGNALTVGGAISDGSNGNNGLVVTGNGILVLSGASTYTGPTSITAGTTLRVGSAGALGAIPGGAVTVPSGAVLDLGGGGGQNFGQKQFNIAGDGIASSGAITNSNAGAGQQNALQQVTLTADASFGGPGRFDIRSANSTLNNNLANLNLNGHTLTSNNTNFIGLVGVEVNDGNIVVNSGSFDFEATTNVKDFASGKNVTFNAGSTMFLWNLSGTVTRPIVMNGGVTMNVGSNAAATNNVIGSNIVLSGGGLTVSGSGGSAEGISGNISESGGPQSITKTETNATVSTLLLSGTNSFTGGLNITSGIVQVGSTGALNTTTPNLVTFNTGGMSAPTLRLGGFSVATGGLASSLATAIVENNNATAATLTVNTTTPSSFAGIVQNGAAAGALSLATSGGGNLTLTGANTYTGATTIGAGSTLQIGNGGTTGSIAGTSGVSGGVGGVLDFNRASGADLTFSAPISGSIGISKDGANNLTLSGTNTNTGPTNINAGVLNITGGSLASTAALNVNSGGILSGASASATTGRVGNVTQAVGGSIQPGATTAIGSNGTLLMNTLTVSGGDYKVDVGSAGSGDLITVAGLAHYTGPSTITPAAAVATSGSPYTVLTAGTLTFDAGATPTVTQISGARVSFSLNLATPNTIKLNVIGSVGNLIWKGNVDAGGGTFLWDVNTTKNWTNTNGNVADFFFNADNVTFDNTATNKTVTINAVAGVAPGTVTVNNSTGNDYTITGSSANGITGTAALTKTGTGTLILNNTNTYTGNTAVQSGILKLGSITALPSTASVILGTGAASGTLDLNGNSPTFAGLATSGTGTANVIGNSSSTSGSTITFAGGTTTFGGIIQDTLPGGSQNVSLTVSAGTLILAGNSTYTGSTSVSAGGILQLGSGGTTGNLSPSTTVTLDGTLNFNRSDTFTFSTLIIGATTTGTVQQSGPGTTILTGGNNYAGPTIISAGTLQVGDGNTTGALGLGAVTDNGTLAFNRSDAVPFGTVISGTGGVRQLGSGTLTLSGFNTFTGNVLVNAGTVVCTVGNNNAAQNSGQFGSLGEFDGLNGSANKTVTVNSGAILSFTTNNVFGNQGNTTAINIPTLDGSLLPKLIINGGTLSSTRYNQLGPITLNGGTLDQSATDGPGAYEGYQFLGTVTVGGTAASTISTGNGKHDHLALNTIFNVGSTGAVGGDLIVSAPLTNASGDYGSVAGGLTKTGSGTMLLSAVNNYAGATTVNQGTLTLGIANATSNASRLVLGGGKLSTGGFAQAMNTLTLSASSGIDLGAGASVLQFANSSAATWAGGSTLSFLNWTGTAGSGGGTDQVIFGTTNAGLTAGQVSQIHFQGFNGATILPTGEVVPTAVSTRLLGDWNVNGVVNGADVTAMLQALTDLNAYKLPTSPLHPGITLTNDDLLNIGDVNLSGTITNADIQAELDKVAPGPGAGSVAGVPEPASILLLGLGMALCAFRRRLRAIK